MRQRIAETWRSLPEPVRKLGKDCAGAIGIAVLTVFGVHASKWLGMTGGGHPFQPGNAEQPKPQYQPRQQYEHPRQQQRWQPPQRNWAKGEYQRRYDNTNDKGVGHGR